MVTHSGASLHRWRYFPLRSPLSSSALWSHTQHLVPPRTVYLSLSHKKKKKRTRGPEPPRGHFLYLQYFSASVFFFFFTGMVKIRTGNSRRGQILCNLQEAAAQRTERSHERQKTELSIIRTPREWSARISERGARYVNEGNFHKLGLAQTEAATEIHKETVREIRGRVQKTDNQFKYHTYLYRKTCCDGEVIKAKPRLDWSDSPADDVSIFKFVSNVHLFMNDVQRRHILQLCVWISTQYLVHWIIRVHHDVILQKVWFGL